MIRSGKKKVRKGTKEEVKKEGKESRNDMGKDETILNLGVFIYLHL